MLGASSEPVKLKLNTMMGKDSIIQSARVSSLRVRGLSSKDWINLPPAYTTDFIPLERSHIPTPKTAERWNHLKGMAQEIPELMDCKVGLLIGYDCSRALAPRSVITGRDDEPYAIKTDLGWSIVGNSSRGARSTEVTGLCHRIAVKELPPLTPATVIKALEFDFRDSNHREKSISKDDTHFMQLLNRTVHQNADGHLEMPLPFKTRTQLPENKRLALVRLKHLKRKLDKNSKFKEDYIQFMEGLFDDGLASVESEDAAIQLVREAQSLCEKGELHLRKFISNSREVLESIPESKRAGGVHDVDLSLGELPMQTVLGVRWSVSSDNFSFKVSTDQNPADHASRGLSVTELINSNWLTGPEFLGEREIVTPTVTPQLMVGDPEVRTTQVLHTQVENEESFLVMLERFSKWHTALNVVGRIQRLAKRTKETGPVSVEERRSASLALINRAQNQCK
jgi:hypothetical protein